MENLNKLCSLINDYCLTNGYTFKYSVATPEEVEMEKTRVELNFKPRKKITDPISGPWLVCRTSPIGYYELFMHLENECIDFIVQKQGGSTTKKILTIYDFHKDVNCFISKSLFLMAEDNELKCLCKWLNDFVFSIKAMFIKPELNEVEKVSKKSAKSDSTEKASTKTKAKPKAKSSTKTTKSSKKTKE